MLLLMQKGGRSDPHSLLVPGTSGLRYGHRAYAGCVYFDGVGMTDLRTAAQQALEALVRASSYYDTYAEIAALEAALAEPVAYSVGRTLHWHEGKGMNDVQLYLAPPQRKPLSEEEIYSLFRTAGSPTAFTRAIERAHGIT